MAEGAVARPMVAPLPAGRELRGLDKAALVLLSLDRNTAVGLLRSFDPDEVRALLAAVERVRTAGAGELDATVGEFEAHFMSGVTFIGSELEVRELIDEAVGGAGPGVTEAEAAGGTSEEPLWTRIAALSDDAIRDCISALPSQVAAFVLTHFEPSRVAELLRPLPPDERNELIERMLRLEKVSEEVQVAIEATLRQKLLTGGASPPPHLRIAGIVNGLEAPQSRDVIDHLATTAPEHATAIRKLLFKFEQLPELTREALTLLFDRIPVERIVTALQGMDVSFQNSVLAALAPRARRLVEAELQGPAAATAREVSQARQAIADAVLELAAEGRLSLDAPDAGPAAGTGGGHGSA